MQLQATVRGLTQLKRKLDADNEKRVKALELSIRKTANGLRQDLKEEIQRGAPGGKKFKSLTYISRGWKIQTGTRLRKDRRFIRMAGAVRYHVQRSPNFQAHIGFTKKSPKANFFRDIVSKHAKGFTKPITDKQRKYLAKQGARRLGLLAGQRRHRMADGVRGNTPFFLRKTTKVFRTPAQPIIEPFWEKNKIQAILRIKRLYNLRKRGIRI